MLTDDNIFEFDLVKKVGLWEWFWKNCFPLTNSFSQHLVGRLIGKQGRYVSFLKQTSGAKIYISALPYTQNVQICHIEGQWVSSPFRCLSF